MPATRLPRDTAFTGQRELSSACAQGFAGSRFRFIAVTEDIPGATGRVVLEHARELGRWLITFDRDYGELVFLHELSPPPAIIFIRQEPIACRVAENLLSDPELESGYFITLGSKTIRRRALPSVV